MSTLIPTRISTNVSKRSVPEQKQDLILRTNNDKYIKNLSTKILTDHETALLAKGLKFIPTLPKPASHKNLLRDFEAFTRSMRLQYIFANSKSKPHQFHVKSNLQPPPQPSVALESYLERTKYEFASITFSLKQRQALKTLRANSEVNLKKADKGTTTVIVDTEQKIQEGLEQVSNENLYALGLLYPKQPLKS